MRSSAVRAAFARGACATLLVVTLGAAAMPPKGTLLAAPPRELRDFTLTDQNGHAFGRAQLRGKPALVFFGFTHCPDVCPAALARLALLQKSHGRELGGARIVFISVDGERDTPVVLKDFLLRYSKDFVGLTGTPRAVRDLAAQFSASVFSGRAADGSRTVEHSGQIHLLDAHGRLYATFYDAPLATMAEVTRAAVN